MSAEIIDLIAEKRRRAAVKERALASDCVCVPFAGGGFAMAPRSEFSAKELADIDFFKRECGL
jgi:hypothetical protein